METTHVIKAFIILGSFMLTSTYVYSQHFPTKYSICEGCKSYTMENLFILEDCVKLIDKRTLHIRNYILKIKENSISTVISKDSLNKLKTMKINQILEYETLLHKQKAKDEKVKYISPVLTHIGRFSHLNIVVKEKDNYAIYEVEHIPGIYGNVPNSNN